MIDPTDTDEFDYDTYGGGVEYYGKFNSDNRDEILLERRPVRVVGERSD